MRVERGCNRTQKFVTTKVLQKDVPVKCKQPRLSQEGKKDDTSVIRGIQCNAITMPKALPDKKINKTY